METWNKLQTKGNWGELSLPGDANGLRDLDREEIIARLQQDADRGQAAAAGAGFHKRPAAKSDVSPAFEAELRDELRRAIESRDALHDEIAGLDHAIAGARKTLAGQRKQLAADAQSIDRDVAAFYGRALRDGAALDLPADLEERQTAKSDAGRRLQPVEAALAGLCDEVSVKRDVLQNMARGVEGKAWAVCRLTADKLLAEYREIRARYERLNDLLRGLQQTARGDLSGVGHASPEVCEVLASRADVIVGSRKDGRSVAIQDWLAFRDRLLSDADAAFQV